MPAYLLGHGAVLTTALATLACVGAVRAHHSGYMYATTPIWIEGKFTSFEPRDPHSFTTLEATAVDGSVRRWVVEGPGQSQLERISIANVPQVGEFLRSDGRALDAWCQQQSYEAVRNNAALSAYVSEIDGLLDQPCR